MRAALLTIGDELVRGVIADTNAAFLGARLFALGAPVRRILSVGDARADIVAALREIAAGADVAIVSGGLGPTDDDRTADAAAEAAGVPRVLHEPSLAHLRERFARRRRAGLADRPPEMTANNERQAYLPAGAEPLPNPVGTAPGFALTLGDCRLYFLPGVPAELEAMFDQHVAPRLRGAAPARRTLRVFGLPESAVDHALADLAPAPATVHYQVRFPEVLVTLVAPDAATLAALEPRVRARLGDSVYGADGDSLAAVVGAALRARGDSLALAESCTGGLLGHLITDVPGASDYFRVGVVAYADEVKRARLGVSERTLREHGAVSDACVVEMADGVRALAGATWGVAISGIAGPGGGSADKPVGTVHLAVAGPDGTTPRRIYFPGTRAQVKRIAAFAALAELRRRCQGASP